MKRFLVATTLIFLQACSTPEQEAERADTSLDSVLARGRQVTMAEAQTLYEDGRYEAAATKFGAIVRADPQNYQAALLLGESLLRLNRPKESVGFFTAAKASPEYEAEALQGMGLAFLQMDDPNLAEEKLDQALSLNPDLWRSHNAMGQIQDSRQEWEQAETSYSLALGLPSDRAVIYNNLGMSYLLQRRFDDAIEQFEQALRLEPDLSPARTNLRMALALDGNYTDALAGVPRSQIADTLNNIGYAAMLRGEYDIAESYLTRAIETSPAYHTKAASNLARVEYLRQKTAGKKAS